MFYDGWDDNDDYPDDHPAFVHEKLSANFRLLYAHPLGERAAERILTRATRRLTVQRTINRLVTPTGIVSAPLLYAWLPGALFAGGLVLGSVFVTSHCTRSGARIAQHLLNPPYGPLLPSPALRRVLGRHLGDIPATAIRHDTWGPVLLSCLDEADDVREILLMLADQYGGTVAELVDVSRALAN
jgi:hypothetical protein